MTTKTSDDYTETLEWLDNLDPETTESKPMPVELRQVDVAARSVDSAEDSLRQAVLTARDAGYSWARIGMALGITRQAVQQRFGD